MESKKQKIIKILKRIGIGLSLGFNVLFLIALIIGSGTSKKQVNNSGAINESNNICEVVRNKPQPRYASYDDSTFKIILSVNELNNYIFNETIDYLSDNFGNSSSPFSVTYNGVESTYSSFTRPGQYDPVNTLWFQFSTYSGSRKYPNVVIDFVDYRFHYLVSSESQYSSFEYDITLNFTNETNYIAFKALFENDISSNESNINDGIFETLTEGVTAFIGSIGSGIVAMTSVFYDSANSQLTTIGLLSVIVVAVSLAYFLFRLIIGLIRMRG